MRYQVCLYLHSLVLLGHLPCWKRMHKPMSLHFWKSAGVMASKFLLADLGGGGGFAFPAASAGGVLALLGCPLVLVVDEFDCKLQWIAIGSAQSWLRLEFVLTP